MLFRLTENTSQYAFMIWVTVDDESRPAGRGLVNRRDTNSARSADSSNNALYISCTCRLPRRMSVMNAMRGFMAAM